MSIYRAIKSSFKLFNRKINSIEEYSSYKTEKLKITSLEKGYLHTDGEPQDRKKETEIRVLKNAMKACANLNLN